MYLFLIFTLLVVPSIAIDNDNDELSVNTLEKVAIVHRHGDRSPIHTYAKDPYSNASYWPGGWGQLTMPGKKRLYALGKFIRNRYSAFLTDNPGEVKVRSSQLNRCLNSVECLLAGAYPPTGDNVIDPQLTWQPFPVKTVMRIHDGMLNPGSQCPAASAEKERIKKLPEVVDYTESKKELLEYLTDNTGDKISGILDADYLYDCLFIEQNQGWPLPAWATPKIMEELKDMARMSFYFAGMTKKMQRLRTGVFFKDVTDNFESHVQEEWSPIQSKGIAPMVSQVKDTKKAMTNKKVNSDDEDDSGPEKKLLLYSSHDTMISVVLQAMNQYNNIAPPYAASIFFELRKHCFNSTSCSERSNDNYYVNIFYLNDTYSEVLHPIIPLGCKSAVKCPLDQFIKGVTPLLVDDFEAECASGSWTVTSSLTGMCCIETLADDFVFEPVFFPEKDSNPGSVATLESSVCQQHKKCLNRETNRDDNEDKKLKYKKCLFSKNSPNTYRICILPSDD